MALPAPGPYTHYLDVTPGPTYPFNFAAFQSTCSSFLESLDKYVANAREEILSRKKERAEQEKEEERMKLKFEEEILKENEKEKALLKTLSQEHTTLSSLKSSVHALKQNLNQLTTQSSSLSGEIAELENKVRARKEKDRSRSSEIMKARKAVEVECEVLEDVLGVKVEGVSATTVKITFTNLSSLQPSATGSLTLDISSDDEYISSSITLYSSVPPSTTSSPNPSHSLPTLELLVEELNRNDHSEAENNNFYVFLRKLRNAFKCVVDEAE